MAGETSLLSCPRCGEPNPGGFGYCGHCGVRLEQACPSCGHAAPIEDRFCGNCGASLTVAAAEAGEVEERKVVTVLYADLTASTELAARLDPEDLRRVLKPFFDAMADEIERFGGTVEKFIGDAIVAVFGVPAAHEDDPERSVRAAFAMQRRLASLSAELAAHSATKLEMRVAVNTGEVVATGRTDREGLITGEAVSVAARLQALARSGGIVVGERTYRDTRDAIGYSELDAVSVKGIGRPLRLWEALSEDLPPGSPSFLPTPLVGRAAELELLRLLLSRTVREKQPNLATVVGPPGIGKSRLGHEFVNAVREERPDVRVVRGRCLAYGDGLTYWPLAEILKADAEILDSDPPDLIVLKARAKLDGRLASEEAAAETAAVLLSSIGHPVHPDPLLEAEAEVAKRLVFRSWRAYFQSLAREQPVAVLLEDLHWADPSLLELIEDLATRLTAPILLLCLARPDLWKRRSGWGRGMHGATTIVLSPLTNEESEDLLNHLLGQAHSPREVIVPVLERAEGNPFFAQELLRMLIEDGVLAQRGEGWTLDREMPASLPDTVQGVIASRIDGLEPVEKRAIQDASVVGRIFWEGILERLGTPHPGTAVDALIEKAFVWERPESTIEGERELIFIHVLTRDVAYASLPRTRRPEAHAKAGEWIEEVTKGRSEEFAEILAYHFEAAGDHARTARYALLAGLRKRRLFAAEEAIRWYDRALAAAEEAPEADGRLLGEIGLARGAALEQLARFSEAQKDYERAAAAARAERDSRLEARALTALVHIHWLEDHYEDGRRVLSEALDRARAVEARDLEARLLYTAGTFAFGRGEWDEALAYQREALAVAADKDEEGEAFARHGLVDACALKGAFREGLEHAERASELARRLGLRPLLYENEFMRGLILVHLGRLAEAAAALEEAVRGTQELGDRRNQGPALGNRSRLRLARGDLGGALLDGEAAMKAVADVESPRMQLTCSTYFMEALAHVGMFERLEEEVRRGLALSDQIGGVYWRSRLHAFEGWLALRAGQVEAAESLFARARELAGVSLLDAMVCAQTELLAWEEAAKPEPLRKAAERLREPAAEESPPFVAWGDYGVALSAAVVEDWESARTGAEEALTRALATGEELVVWRSLALLVRVLDALGRQDDAAERRADATSKLEEIAATIEDPDVRADFLVRHQAWIEPLAESVTTSELDDPSRLP
jgi:class 3 adenylate cyclase/tetratricopeptide (TPR) repeat protein